jgi:hypothetical protein
MEKCLKNAIKKIIGLYNMVAAPALLCVLSTQHFAETSGNRK